MEEKQHTKTGGVRLPSILQSAEDERRRRYAWMNDEDRLHEMGCSYDRHEVDGGDDE